MPAKPQATRSSRGKTKPKSKMKLVGYMEDRTIADKVLKELRKRGIGTTEVLRPAFRGAIDGAAADQWTMKESVLARRVGLNKETIARMRRAGKLADETGPLWKKKGSNFLYDVARSREFFLGGNGAVAAES